MRPTLMILCGSRRLPTHGLPRLTGRGLRLNCNVTLAFATI